MTIREYRYYDAENKCLDWDNLIADLSNAGKAMLFYYMGAVITRQESTLLQHNGNN